MLDLSKINSPDWFNWQQPAKPLYLGACFEAVGAPFSAKFGVNFFTSVLYFRPSDDGKLHLGSWLLRFDEGKVVGDFIVRQLFSARMRERTLSVFENKCEELLSQCASLTESIRARKHDDIVRCAENFSSSFIEFYSVGCITEPVQWRCEEILLHPEKGLLRQQNLAETIGADRLKSALFYMQRPAYTFEIEKHYAKLVQAFLREDEAASVSPQLESALNAFTDQFSWHKNNYAGAKGISTDDLIAEVRAGMAGREFDDLDSHIESLQRLRDQSYDDHNMVAKMGGAEVSLVMEIADSFGSGMADFRKSVMLRAIEAIDTLAEYSSLATGWSKHDVELLTLSEVSGFLDSPDQFVAEIRQRRANFVIIESPQALCVSDLDLELQFQPASTLSRGSGGSRVHQDRLSGTDADRALSEINRYMHICLDTAPRGVIRGTVAFRGPKQKISGIARIISDPFGQSLNTGEILVATSTTPDFMHLIKDAVAIVTDQSGLTTHAALTSRELGIPCIVGTSVASAVFTDGEAIMIDMDEATVERVEALK